MPNHMRLLRYAGLILFALIVFRLEQSYVNSRDCKQNVAACKTADAKDGAVRKMPCRFIGVWNRKQDRRSGGHDETVTLKDDGTYTIEAGQVVGHKQAGKWFMRSDTEMVFRDDKDDPPEQFYVQSVTLTHFHLARHGWDDTDWDLAEPVKSTNCVL